MCHLTGFHSVHFYLVLSSRVKSKLHAMMQTDKNLCKEDDELINPCHQVKTKENLNKS